MSKSLHHHVVLTSHPDSVFREVIPIKWGAKKPMERGPIVGSLSHREQRNSIGTHGGSYSVYRALANAAGKLPSDHIPDLTNTTPVDEIGPHSSWFDPKKMVSIDPWGAKVFEVFKEYYREGYDIRPTIAVTRAHIYLPEIKEAIEKGRLEVDGELVSRTYDVAVTKAAIDPVWYLPGIAERFGVSEGDLRRVIYEQTGGMFPELITRHDLKVLLPPIGNTTVYIFGDVKKIGNTKYPLTVRVHDECNGSDVFGSDICTCRPYLTHGIEEAIRGAQNGGVGMIVYFRKEGRALGEVTKFLVYNARKRQKGGDTAANYFYRTECVAGVQDMRFQELMPDTLHWFGLQQIDRFVSMSDMKHDAIVRSGIKIKERIEIPDGLIPKDARVEMEAKKAAGYFAQRSLKRADLRKIKGRGLEE